MSGFSLQVEIKNKDIERELDKILDRLDDLTPFYKNVGEHVQETTPKHFENETAPDGTAWQKLSPITLARRAKRGTGSTIYRERGDFIQTINYDASSDNFRWGSADVRARIFQEGGKAGKNHAATLPARPYIGLSPDDEEEILNIAKDHVGL